MQSVPAVILECTCGSTVEERRLWQPGWLAITLAIGMLIGWAGVAAFSQSPPSLPLQPAQARLIAALEVSAGPCFCLAWHSRSQRVLVGADNGTLTLLDRPTVLGTRLGTHLWASWPAHRGPVLALEWKSRPVSAGVDGRVVVWDDATWQPVQTWSFSGPIRAARESPQAPVLAIAGDEPTIALLDLQKNAPIGKLAGHADWVVALAWSSDGQFLASASYDGLIKLWRPASADKPRDIPALPPSDKDKLNFVLALAFSPDGKSLAAAGTDGMIRLYNTGDGNLIRTFAPAHGSSVTALAFLPDGQTLVSASKDRGVRLWNVGNGQLVKALEGHESWVTDVAIASSEGVLISSSVDRTVRLWDLRPPR